MVDEENTLDIFRYQQGIVNDIENCGIRAKEC